MWAAVVQANSLIWKPGLEDHGASVIWSPDPYFDDQPDDLQALAHDLYSLKGHDQADPGAAVISRVLTDELIRANNLAVPMRFTEGRKIFHSSVMLSRKHLPDGLLTRGLMPVWVDPHPTGMLLLIPAAFWPASLLAWWKGQLAPVAVE